MLKYGFESMTYAMKAKKLLRRNGVESSVIRLDNMNEKTGCSYGLEVEDGYMLYIPAILQRAAIPYKLLG